MKIITLTSQIVFLLFSTSAIAGTIEMAPHKTLYKVAAEIKLAGKVIATPQFIIQGSEPASVNTKDEKTKSEFKLTTSASDFSNSAISEGIRLKMDLDYKTEKKHITAHPRALVIPGEDAWVTVTTDSGDKMEMKIKAERK